MLPSELASIAAAAIAGVIVGWVGGPLRWPLENHALRKMLRGHRFVFVFDPQAGKKKLVSFLPYGTIGIGRDDNEYRWRIRHGALEIFHYDGTLRSRFTRDRVTGRLQHTNEPALIATRGQYFLLEHLPERPG